MRLLIHLSNASRCRRAASVYAATARTSDARYFRPMYKGIAYAYACEWIAHMALARMETEKTNGSGED